MAFRALQPPIRRPSFDMANTSLNTKVCLFVLELVAQESIRQRLYLTSYSKDEDASNKGYRLVDRSLAWAVGVATNGNGSFLREDLSVE